jgi:hypothetical protein
MGQGAANAAAAITLRGVVRTAPGLRRATPLREAGRAALSGIGAGDGGTIGRGVTEGGVAARIGVALGTAAELTREQVEPRVRRAKAGRWVGANRRSGCSPGATASRATSGGGTSGGATASGTPTAGRYHLTGAADAAQAAGAGHRSVAGKTRVVVAQVAARRGESDSPSKGRKPSDTLHHASTAPVPRPAATMAPPKPSQVPSTAWFCEAMPWLMEIGWVWLCPFKLWKLAT